MMNTLKRVLLKGSKNKGLEARTKIQMGSSNLNDTAMLMFSSMKRKQISKFPKTLK